MYSIVMKRCVYIHIIVFDTYYILLAFFDITIEFFFPFTETFIIYLLHTINNFYLLKYQ